MSIVLVSITFLVPPGLSAITITWLLNVILSPLSLHSSQNNVWNTELEQQKSCNRIFRKNLAEAVLVLVLQNEGECLCRKS